MSEFNGTLVKARGVSKNFKRGSETIHVLADLDLDIPAGDFLSLMGPSGSGKTTLLNLIGGLDRPDTGSVEVGGDRRVRPARAVRSGALRHVLEGPVAQAPVEVVVTAIPGELEAVVQDPRRREVPQVVFF